MTQALRKLCNEPTPNERLAECAREARKQATLLPAGYLRDALLEKARQYEAQISRRAGEAVAGS